MMSTEKKNVENEEIKAKQNEQGAAENQQPDEQEQKPEKKKRDWKGIGKKVLIGAGAVTGAMIAFGAGYLTGSHNGSESDQADVSDAGSDSE